MNIKTGFWGFVLDGLIGLIVTVLYAPQSRDKTRQILAENNQKMKENALNSIQETQDFALTKLNQV
jgi:gas vesicle protein